MHLKYIIFYHSCLKEHPLTIKIITPNQISMSITLNRNKNRRILQETSNDLRENNESKSAGLPQLSKKLIINVGKHCN